MRSHLVTALVLLYAGMVVGRDLRQSAPQGGDAAAQSVRPAQERKPSPPPRANCWPHWGGAKRTVLFVADPGVFSGTPEAFIYLKNLQRNKTVPTSETGCPQVEIGVIMGLPVAIITTGIGTDSASTCTYEVLIRCGSKIKDVIYSGTSGWSPQLGGIINNGTCEAGTANDNGKITRIGDVCVTPFSVNYVCRKASWYQMATGYANECTFPDQDFNAMTTELFGQCYFAGAPAKDSLPLSDEVIAAGRAYMASTGIPRPPRVQSHESAYWGNMSEGTGLSYNVDANAIPTIWDYKQCAPSTAQAFRLGAPWDMVQRKYVADTINAAGMQGVTVDQTDVIAVNEMESVGFALAMQRYAGFGRVTPIPYTTVRGMSDNVVPTLAMNGTVPNSADTLWVNGVKQPEDFATGYAYAIRTASATVLVTLQRRCQQAGGRDVATRCQFVM